MNKDNVKNVAFLLAFAALGAAADYGYHASNSNAAANFFKSNGCQSVFDKIQLHGPLQGKIRDVLVCPDGSAVGITK